eukprot:maker-scaffold_7-snap-gene-9.3-mRNA-1 protein AED:0.00 eAED:0.00 QI:63/1/1/1/1/1/2/38/641
MSVKPTQSVKGEPNDDFTLVESRGRLTVRQKLRDYARDTLNDRKELWYRPPKMRQFWGDEQEELETDWAELFFDLIYVAMAFKLGTQLEDDITAGEFLRAVIVLIAQFSPMFAAWYIRLIYLSRVVTNSLFHKVLDVVEGVLVALMALFISTSPQIFDFFDSVDSKDSEEVENISLIYAAEDDEKKTLKEINFILAFTCCFCLVLMVYIFKYYEMLKFSHAVDDDQKQRIEVTATQRLRECCFTLGIMLLAVILALVGVPYGTIWILALSFLIMAPIGIVFFAVLYSIIELGKQVGVPVHVNFIAERLGEFTMLMLGEGVLQIIILAVDTNNLREHLVCFILSFSILSALQVLNFTVLPFEAEEHVFRRSGIRVPQFLVLEHFFTLSLVAVGVGLKTLLKKQDELDDPKNERFEYLLMISLTVGTVLLSLLNVTHLGIYEIIWTHDPYRGKVVDHFRVVLFLLETFLPFVFIAIPSGESTSCELLLVEVWALLIVIFAVYTVDNKYYLLSHEEINLLESNSDGDSSSEGSVHKKLTFAEKIKFEDKVARARKQFETMDPEKFKRQEERRRKDLELMFHYLRDSAQSIAERVENTDAMSCSVKAVTNLVEAVEELESVTTMIKDDLERLLACNLNLANESKL